MISFILETTFAQQISLIIHPIHFSVSFRKFLFSILLLLPFYSAFSQGSTYSTPVGAQGISDYLRRQELITGQRTAFSPLQQNY
ncbi:MAG: hypothetical protein NTZ47_00870 [Bacteroidetes bacterium]|nr:hypothetical protein [Bacteroidota bacterium]